jgi:RNA polymerase sigma factor (TIGR02999 family)
MSSPPSSSVDITDLLVRWGDGDQEALGTLMALVEVDLRRLAHFYMRGERPGHLLQTTALLNEAFLRLVDQDRVSWQNRAHFFAIASRIMRRILLNYVRDQGRIKRGGGMIEIAISDCELISPQKSAELIALDDALNKLATFDERKSQVVELRFFGGLTVEEIAEVLNVSVITVNRDWNAAKAWLAREIKHGS